MNMTVAMHIMTIYENPAYTSTTTVVHKLLSLEERSRLYRILSADTLADILEYAENKTEYIGEISI